MNRKIFTLLASALMLFSATFYANANVPRADRSVGAYVNTLPANSKGMYHIQVDSILLADWAILGFTDSQLRNNLRNDKGEPRFTYQDLINGTLVPPSTTPALTVDWIKARVAAGERAGTDPIGGTHMYWVGVTPTGTAFVPGGLYLEYSFTSDGEYRYNVTTAPLVRTGTAQDTIILSVTEKGNVQMISSYDLQEKFAGGKAKILDLQASMWCVNVEQDPSKGQVPTFHFVNKVFDRALDWEKAGTTTLATNEDKGWMFSYSSGNEPINRHRPFHRHEPHTNSAGDLGYYRVVKANLSGGTSNGVLTTSSELIGDFTNDRIHGMMMFTLVKAAPFVLTAEAFNSQVGFNMANPNAPFKLEFNPTPTQPSPLNTYELLTQKSTTSAAAADLGYLNVGIYEGNKRLGFLANSNKKEDTEEKYNNLSGVEYLNLLVKDIDKDKTDISDTGYNHSYRFVYFPSEDSLVINAYHVRHNTHSEYGSDAFTDQGYGSHATDVHMGLPGYDDYKGDTNPLEAPRFYGLYSEKIHDALIVRYQDLSFNTNNTNIGNASSSMITIARHYANVRWSFGRGCEEIVVDSWQPSQGVYTIWDQRGRVLGVRIYNGTYSPQWIELDEGECPDRIPSYQWAIQPSVSGNSLWRVDIINREFGDLTTADGSEHALVQMKNILIRTGYSTIFDNQPQFNYAPIHMNSSYADKYEPIIHGQVRGRYLDVIEAGECGLGGVRDYSGFRPVTNEYLKDQYLGYKHFHVEQDPTHVSYGKSEDVGGAKGMDYNAYAFKYYHYILEEEGIDAYINLKERNNEMLLNVNAGRKEGYQFMLGTFLRSRGHVEESFGYPSTSQRAHATGAPWRSERKIVDPITGVKHYDQVAVPVLKRYYYELKIADFYEYRNGLSEQYVVLKGAKNDNSDANNAMKYGVADVWHDKEPYKFANIYLRESMFLTAAPSLNEERHPADPSRRIYYALLDRIEKDQLERVVQDGLEVSDTLRHRDGATPYNLATLHVHDKESWVDIQGKNVSSARVALFSLENVNYPLYRRLRSLRDDNASEQGDGLDPTRVSTHLDAPKVVRINRDRDPSYFLQEDGLSNYVYNRNINYLGVSNIYEHPEELASDGLVKYNYHLFIDTAFINRGTGWIKPQYLIAVGVNQVKAQKVTGTDACGDPYDRIITPYTEGRYLVNATDSARGYGSDGTSEARNHDYIFDSSWDRLAFVEAIHDYANDRLYIVSELEKRGITRESYTIDGDDGKKYLDMSALLVETEKPGGSLVGTERLYDNSKMYGTYYHFGNWDNYHNDVTFSLRFVHPNVENPDANGDDVSSNFDKRFLIESETTNRTPYGNRKIAPVRGGWVKLQNFVPVMSRGSYEDAIQQAEVFNIADPVVTSWQNGQATANDNIAKVNVVAGEGSVTIANAAGKQVVISNMLGQVVVSKVLTSNNETVKVSNGVVVVSVDGNSTKAVVK